MLELKPKPDIVEITAAGTLRGDDYDRFVPELESLAEQRGPLRLYIELREFRGWDPEGLWKEVKFDVSHQDAMEKVAIVGENALEEWGTRLSKPFFRADVRYFSSDEADEARRWVKAG